MPSPVNHIYRDETGGRSISPSRPFVMVCLSPSPSCKRVIRTAAKMAFSRLSHGVASGASTEREPGKSAKKNASGRDHFSEGPLFSEELLSPEGSGFSGKSPSGAERTDSGAESRPDVMTPIALYVSATGNEADESTLLRENIQYARKFGFEIHTVRGTDIPLAIAEFARRVGVTDLFLGYRPPSFVLWSKPAINEKLLSYLPTVDIHIVPDPVSSPYPETVKKRGIMKPSWNLRDLVLVIVVMTVATLLCCWFYMSRFSNTNIVTIYILGVLITSVMTSSRIYGTLAAILYVLLFNFLFIEPRFTLLVYDSAYLMTYLVTVIAALITGTVAVRMKNIARASAENAYQAKVLLDTSNQLESAADSDAIIHTTCMQLVHLLNRAIVYFPPEAVKTMETVTQEKGVLIFPAGDKTISPETLTGELEAVRLAMDMSHNVGAFTSHFGNCSCRYLSIYSGPNQYGVIGIDMGGHPLEEFETTVLLSIIHECTMALENKRMAQEQKKAEIQAENERLRAGLLRSISHDLRTPLTSIYGNACNLRNYEEDLPREERDKIYEDIMEDADWLNAQFENILAMTRLESGIGIRMTIENMEDVIEQSLRYVTSLHSHRIIYDTGGQEDQIFFARMDPKLIMQVFVNLLNNAVKYTPKDSEIRVHMERSADQIIVEVSDNGPGIDDEDKPYIFDLFYNGKKSLTDSYRSMGIGLNLCAEILKVHHGTIEVLDNTPTGAVFRFCLPAADFESSLQDTVAAEGTVSWSQPGQDVTGNSSSGAQEPPVPMPMNLTNDGFNNQP